MKKLFVFLLFCIALFILASVSAFLYVKTGPKAPDNSVWQSFIGRDTAVGILPDQYANYYTYTLVRSNKNAGFKIKGQFPDTRYFSFNVYSLGDNITQGSIIDHQLQTDSGKPNPFLVEKDSVDFGTNFTVHILPEKFKEYNYPNALYFKDDVNLLTMVMRLYDYNIDDFGGVDLPKVESFEIEDGSDQKEELALKRIPKNLNLRTLVRRTALPKMVERLGLLYQTEYRQSLDAANSETPEHPIPFHAIDTKGFIENNDNRYLLAGITKAENELYVFRFKSPSFTTGHENIKTSEVRYWSFNLGNAASYNFNALKDEDALLDEQGFVNIVLADKNEKLEAYVSSLGYNFLEWNMPWKKALILFRHMLADPNFHAQIDDVPAINKEMSDFTEIEASKFIGAYAPKGKRMTIQEFYESYPENRNDQIKNINQPSALY